MSKFSKDPMGDRMKQYEYCSSSTLIDGTPKIIRLDGKAFHSWVKKARCEKPFDKRLMQSMISGAKAVMNEIGGVARFAYIQSDECSIVINDKLDIHTQPWFGNKVQKIASVSAALMSVAFTREWDVLTSEYLPAAFDARVFQVPTIAEMNNAILWRQFDASRNSVSQYARNYFSHKQLHKKSSSDMQDMMLLEKGFNWNDAPTWTKRGMIVARFDPNEDVECDQGIEPYLTVDNSLKEYWEIPLFNHDQGYLQLMFRDYEAQENEYIG